MATRRRSITRRPLHLSSHATLRARRRPVPTTTIKSTTIITGLCQPRPPHVSAHAARQEVGKPPPQSGVRAVAALVADGEAAEYAVALKL